MTDPDVKSHFFQYDWKSYVEFSYENIEKYKKTMILLDDLSSFLEKKISIHPGFASRALTRAPFVNFRALGFFVVFGTMAGGGSLFTTTPGRHIHLDPPPPLPLVTAVARLQKKTLSYPTLPRPTTVEFFKTGILSKS